MPVRARVVRRAEAINRLIGHFDSVSTLSFPRFSGHYLKGGYDVQNADQISG